MSCTHQDSQKGSILIYAFLMVVTIGILAAGMTTIVQNRLGNQVRETVYVERNTDIDSSAAVLAATAFRAYVNLDPTTFPALLTGLKGALSPTLDDVTFTNTFFSPSDPFARNAVFGPLPPTNATDAFYRSNHARLFRFGTTAVFSGPKAGVQSASIGSFAEDVVVNILEMPTADFQLVTYATPFSGSPTSNLLISGKALFAEGLNPSGALNSFAVSDFSISMGQSAGVFASHNPAQVAKGGAITWGGATGADLFAESGTGIVARQSFLLEDPSNLEVIYWTFPAVEPIDLPEGITFEVFDGASRLILDLGLIAESSRFQIRCSAATESSGVVIRGSANSSLSTISIVTNGRVSLSGSNVRPALIASNFQGNHRIYSEDYIEGSSGIPSADTSFLGYLFFEQDDLRFDLRENWSGSSFTIVGSLVFRGGSVRGPTNFEIRRDSDFINLMANGMIKSDRFAYISF